MCEIIWFFPRWILICLTWNLSRSVPSSVEILTWIFYKKSFRENFSDFFLQTKVIILYYNFWNFAILSAILFCVHIELKKIIQILSHDVFTQLRRHAHKQITKMRYREEIPGRFFSFQKTGFLHSRSRTYYALFLKYFGLKILTNIRHCVYRVLAKIWVPNSKEKIRNKLFMPGSKRSFVCVWNCLIFFLGEYSSVRPEICCVLSQIQTRFLSGISGKKLFRENFSEILLKTKAILYRNSWNFVLLSAILFWERIALKKFAQVLSYVVCTQVRRHDHKQITKRRYGEEKQEHFVFRKPSFFTLGLGLTTPYSLDISVSNYYQTFLTVSIDIPNCVYWGLAKIWVPILNHRIWNKFFIHHCQGRKEGSFVCETVWFFS